MLEGNNIRVSAREMKILSSLREQPEGELRDLYEQLLLRLAELMRNPCCPEVQADGTPCDAPTADCVLCLRLEDMLRTLSETLPNDGGHPREADAPAPDTRLGLSR